MILNAGMTQVMVTVRDEVDEGELGTGTTAVAFSDTDLATGVDATKSTGANASMSKTTVVNPQIVVFEYKLESTGANNTYQEFGLRDSGDDVLYSRILITSIVKTATIEIPVVARFQFLRGQ